MGASPSPTSTGPRRERSPQNPHDGDPALAADGETLAFVRRGNILITDLNGRKPVCLPVGPGR